MLDGGARADIFGGFGFSLQVRGLVERYATELGRWPHVVLTGGYARLIAKKCDFADSVVPTLCLTGIYLAYVKWRAAQESEAEEVL